MIINAPNAIRNDFAGAPTSAEKFEGAILEWPKLVQANFEGQDLTDLNEDLALDTNE
ncbi:MAG: hypothetical protein RMX68_006875 [Aulosira sp. ZfuVER01]|nr:hypothetical protein [Aulosira sp. ZfuVER01]MDZ8001640.1 hypothetical protein [Aulosira sp. DedVER01a]MDZ8051492.1 hypothetical protein [Aulosira sp. ZfuCHP01]